MKYKIAKMVCGCQKYGFDLKTFGSALVFYIFLVIHS